MIGKLGLGPGWLKNVSSSPGRTTEGAAGGELFRPTGPMEPKGPTGPMELLESISARTETLNFELPGTDGFRAALALREVEYEASGSIGAANGTGGSRQMRVYGMDLEIQLEADSPEGLAKGIKALQEHFSPEKVSERIVRLALSRFEASTDDPELAKAEREDYAEWIGGVVDAAFESAQELLGGLWPSVENVVNDTHGKVGQLFDAFVDGGFDAVATLVESWRAARETASEDAGPAVTTGSSAGTDRVPGVLDLEA